MDNQAGGITMQVADGSQELTDLSRGGTFAKGDRALDAQGVDVRPLLWPM